MEISNLCDNEFTVTVIKRLMKLGRIDEHSRNFNKDIESIRKYQIEVPELKSTITKLNNTLVSFNSRLDKVTERIGDIEDKAVDFTQQSSKKITRILQNEDILKDL